MARTHQELDTDEGPSQGGTATEVAEPTEEELEAFRRVQRAKRAQRTANMTQEQLIEVKNKRSRYNQKRLEDIKADPERNAARLARQRDYQQKRKMFLATHPEAAAAHRDKQRAYRQGRQPENMTPTERLAAIEKEQSRLAALRAETEAEIANA